MVREKAEVAKPMTSGPLIKGIPSLGPNSSRVLVWGQYGGLVKSLSNPIVNVTCTFTNSSGRLCEPVECILEIKSFDRTDMVDPDGARQSAKQLKRIADELQCFRKHLEGPRR